MKELQMQNDSNINEDLMGEFSSEISRMNKTTRETKVILLICR